MWWIALLPQPSHDSPASSEVGVSLAWWALQWTPRVSLLDEAVLLEVQASERLFGGRRALLQRLRAQAGEAGAAALVTAPTALAALALLRQRDAELASKTGAEPGPGSASPLALLPATGCGTRRLHRVLDGMPLAYLSATRAHADTLRQLGCHTLGALRALPREGVARRFGAGLLLALDQAYGLQADALRWVAVPERFDQRLECPSAVEHAQGLLFGAQRLLARLHAWLAARQRGVLAIALHWEHDRLRRSTLRGGRVTVRTAQATRDMPHLTRLLAEHLARAPLAAPATAMRLVAEAVAPLPTASQSLWADTAQAGEGWGQLLERLSARLGPQQVLQGQLCADHRPEAMARWVPATAARQPPAPAMPATLAWQPPWLLREPLRLAVEAERPIYQGPLQLLSGPQRLETGWWVDARGNAPPAQRDYHVALSPRAGLVWIFLQHGPTPAWFLHGIYG